MKKVIFACLCVCNIALFAQKTDTLDLISCQQLAIKNYPLIKQKDLLAASSDLKIKNLNTQYYPQLSLNGQATYQSAVTTIPQMNPNVQIPVISNDQYKISLDVNQVIWDGGYTTAQKNLEVSGLQSEKLSVDIELERIKERINQIFFNILLTQKSEKIIQSVQNDLASKIKKIEAGVKNDVQLQSNADVLKAEFIKTEQQLIELATVKQVAVKMLAEFINQPISGDVVFTVPETEVASIVFDNKRLEMKLFDYQMNKLDVSKQLTTSRIMPRFYAFGQGGYGRPGLDMLSDQFDFYYIFGAKLSWNISGFYQTGREKKIIDLQKDFLGYQKETFDKNLKISTQKELNNIAKYQQLIEKDAEIVRLRENITRVASVQLENGVITSTEYMTEKDAETQAKFNIEFHKVQLQMSKLDYLNAMGKL